MKLTKQQAKLHAQAEEILEQDTLSLDEKEFVLENWHEGAKHVNSAQGAFFTPSGLANDFCIETWDAGNRFIDLCAGIGCLSFHVRYRNPEAQIVCVETNPDYVAVGRKILPEADWVRADVLDLERITALGLFDCAISNPPFGRVKSEPCDLRYTGSDFEFKVIEVASRIAKYGVLILPQMSTPFKYSGNRYFENVYSTKYEKFKEQTGIEFEFNCGIDTAYHKDDWRGVSPICEIVTCNFEGDSEC